MDKIYTYPAFIKVLGRILVILAIFVWVLIGIIILADAETPIAFMLFATAFLVVFGGLGLLLTRMNSMSVVLLQDRMIFTRANKQSYVAYDDIISVSHSSRIFSAMILHTQYKDYSIRKNLIDYPEFAEILKIKVKALQQELRDSLAVKCKAWEFYISTGIFIVLAFGMWVVALVAGILGEISVGNAVVVTVVLLPFVIGLLIALLHYPRQYDFTKFKIVKTFLSGAKDFDVSQIVRVEYGQKKIKTYSRYGSSLSHFIEIDFAEKKKYIRIDQAATDFPVEDIAAYVQNNYSVEGKMTKVQMNRDNN